jgi:uncharacterized membrane protein
MSLAVRRLSIGRILSRGAATVAAAPGTTIGIAFLFGALPSALFSYGLTAAGGAVRQLPPGAATGLSLLGALVGITLSMLVQGALVRATTAHAQGRRVSFGECAATGLRAVLPLAVLSIVVGFGFAVGLLLFVVPGIILYVTWSVAAPALVSERRSILGALARSRALTRGARWNIFALFFVMFVIYWLLSAVVGVVGVLGFGTRTLINAASLGPAALPAIALGTAVQTVVAAFWGTIQTALYVELRDLQDGPPTDVLAGIFA